MRRSLGALLLVLAPLAPLAAGCGKAPPQSGIVMEREYDDPDTWMESVPHYITVPRPYTRTSYSYSSTCKCSMPSTTSGIEYQTVVGYWSWERRHDGPHWNLKIRDDKDPKNIQWVEISQEDFNHFEAGSHWPQPAGGGDF